ncbi:hypothetical protein GCM10010909_02620 [Acidocella aquatica]|uniref:Rhamnan synthesis protein F n=1 Tax=Acidocella aquatica TaxID=1922313 RepID=A0ABQ6A068_9PROT|nr:rhamnan synthesis F family protein [Acidocella aquatica]GLR65584.1 hypothetical protein GCM10010909_02620 [Acidocella aquatica]
MAPDPHQPPAPLRGVYLLRPFAAAQSRGYLKIGLQKAGAQPREWLLPVGLGLNFFVDPEQTGVTLSFAPGEAALERVGRGTAMLARLRRRFKTLSLGVLNFDGVKIFPAGSKRQYKTYCKHVRFARISQTPPDGDIMREHPELITGWPPAAPAGAPATITPTPRIAVALHLHYADLWSEIATLLGRWSLPFTLFLTITSENKDLTSRVTAAFPGAIVRIVENSGRDVRPFLLLLEEGAFDGFDFVCKIHGKKSVSHGRVLIFGDIWRRATFLDLIATGAQLHKIIRLFQDDPKIGIAGPARFFIVSDSAAPRDLLGNNRPVVEEIAARMGAPIQGDTFDFFEGTMFWARPQALEPLRRLQLSAAFQTSDAGRGNGALEHALERLFNHAARAAGFRAEQVTGTII